MQKTVVIVVAMILALLALQGYMTREPTVGGIFTVFSALLFWGAWTPRVGPQNKVK